MHEIRLEACGVRDMITLRKRESKSERERERDVERLGRQHNNFAVDEVAVACSDEQYATLIVPHRVATAPLVLPFHTYMQIYVLPYTLLCLAQFGGS